MMQGGLGQFLREVRGRTRGTAPLTLEALRVRRRGIAAVIRGRAFECPACRGFSYHPDDVLNHYCTCCGGPGLPKCCEHDPTGLVAEDVDG
jgi:hypothetical protein